MDAAQGRDQLIHGRGQAKSVETADGGCRAQHDPQGRGLRLGRHRQIAAKAGNGNGTACRMGEVEQQSDAAEQDESRRGGEQLQQRPSGRLSGENRQPKGQQQHKEADRYGPGRQHQHDAENRQQRLEPGWYAVEPGLLGKKVDGGPVVVVVVPMAVEQPAEQEHSAADCRRPGRREAARQQAVENGGCQKGLEHPMCQPPGGISSGPPDNRS